MLVTKVQGKHPQLSSLLSNPFLKLHLPVMSTSAPVAHYEYKNKKTFEVEVEETNLQSKRSNMMENVGKKPNIVSMMLQDKPPSSLSRSSLSMSSCQDDVGQDNSSQLEKGSLSCLSDDWNPSFPYLEPSSLLDSPGPNY